MAQHKSAEKAARQAVRRNLRNRMIRSECSSSVKKFLASIADPKKVDKEKAEKLFRETQATLKRAASKGIFKKETISRKVARLNKNLHKAVSA